MSKNCILTPVNIVIEHHENQTEFVYIGDSMPRGITRCIDVRCRVYQQRNNFSSCNPGDLNAGQCSSAD